ncbi:MAG: glycosylhydrolase-like jelly roll fold domain-containing protein, partial [Mariniphaga sp.]|nr:glycosylhydrolase-like jelly roll fold domain-containing protein [Mariniphaga sp.]
EKPGEKIFTVEGPWEVTFEHVNGETFTRNFDKLNQFGTLPDEQLNTFAGTATYKTTFNFNENAKWLQLGKVNKGVTEVFLNDENVGLNWYGKPVFNIEKAVKSGENQLEIKVTTVLSNYVMSLENNPTAERWTRGYTNIPAGQEGEVTLFSD